jgi:hypothetical protein
VASAPNMPPPASLQTYAPTYAPCTNAILTYSSLNQAGSLGVLGVFAGFAGLPADTLGVDGSFDNASAVGVAGAGDSRASSSAVPAGRGRFGCHLEFGGIIWPCK